MTKTAGALFVAVLLMPADATAQCPSGVSKDSPAMVLVSCLGHPDPKIRDAIAFESLSAMMRAGKLDQATLTSIQKTLLPMVAQGDAAGFQRPFAALVLAEIARTDRVKPWMPDVDRAALVEAAAGFLSSTTDYRAFNDKEGYRHGVAHGADFAMQLALNPAVTKPQLDRLLAAIATQIAPADPSVAYWGGEPDRLARPVIFIAQRKQHSDAEWKAWFEAVMTPKPLESWDAAFRSERGIRKRHNARAFLLSVFATASTTDDAGIKLLLDPVRNSLKLVP